MVDQAIPEKSTFERLLSGMTKLNDATLNLVSKKIGIDTGITQREILSGDKEYNARDFLDNVGQKIGKDLEFGSPEKQTAAQKTLNFATEMAVSIATDPLTYLSGGSNAVAKSIGKQYGLADDVVKGISRGTSGAVLGAAMGDDLPSATLGAVAGGALGSSGPALIRAGGRTLNKAFGEPIVNFATKAMNPEAFEGTDLTYSQAFNLAKEGAKRTDDITRKVRELNNVLELDKLSPDDAKDVAGFLDSKNSAWHTYRNDLERGIIKERMGIQPLALVDDTPLVYNPKAENDIFKIPIAGGENTLYLQDTRYKDSFGARYIINKEGDRFVKYGSFQGKPNFVKVKEHGKLEHLVKKKDLARMRLVKSLDEFEADDIFRHGITDKNGKALISMTPEELNLLSRKSNTYIGKLVDEQLAKENNPVKTAMVTKFRQRNRNMIDLYNKEMIKHKGADFIPIEPVDFHTLEVKPRMKGARSYEGIVEGFARRRSDDPIQTADLTFPERVELETQRYKNSFLREKEIEAERLLANVKFIEPKSDVAKRLHKFVNGYDDFTKFIKQQHLTFSHTWVVNNFVDNLTKAYMSGGPNNLWSAMKLQSKAALRDSADPVVKDLLRLTDPNMIKTGVKFNDELTEMAKEFGAINEGLFSETFARGQISKEMLIAKLGIDDATKAIAEAGAMSDVAKTYDKYSQFLAGTVGRTGALIESAGRLSTFKHHFNDILKSDEALEKLGVKLSQEQIDNSLRMGYKKAREVYPSLDKVFTEASRITNEVFFDYNNISVFEETVMKRLFPYWTYFSRNFPQWIEMATSNPTALRNVTRMYTTLGEKPTDQERKALPDYMLKSGARIKDGKAITMPNMSLLDSLNATTGEFEGLSKIHPMIKFAYQMIARKNEFGNELLPSNTRTGQVRLTGAGEKFAPFTDRIYRDKSQGNKQFTDSDVVQVLKTAQQNLAPVPAIDTIARVLTKMKEGTPLSESLLNLGPIKTTTLTEQDKMRTRLFRDTDARKKAQYEQDIANAKRLSNK